MRRLAPIMIVFCQFLRYYCFEYAEKKGLTTWHKQFLNKSWVSYQLWKSTNCVNLIGPCMNDWRLKKRLRGGRHSIKH